MNELIYEYFKGGGKIRPDSALYTFTTSKEVSRGFLLGYLDANGRGIDEVEDDLNVSAQDIFEFMSSYNRHEDYSNTMIDELEEMERYYHGNS